MVFSKRASLFCVAMMSTAPMIVGQSVPSTTSDSVDTPADVSVPSVEVVESKKIEATSVESKKIEATSEVTETTPEIPEASTTLKSTKTRRSTLLSQLAAPSNEVIIGATIASAAAIALGVAYHQGYLGDMTAVDYNKLLVKLGTLDGRINYTNNLQSAKTVADNIVTLGGTINYEESAKYLKSGADSLVTVGGRIKYQESYESLKSLYPTATHAEIAAYLKLKATEFVTVGGNELYDAAKLMKYVADNTVTLGGNINYAATGEALAHGAQYLGSGVKSVLDNTVTLGGNINYEDSLKYVQGLFTTMFSNGNEKRIGNLLAKLYAHSNASALVNESLTNLQL